MKGLPTIRQSKRRRPVTEQQQQQGSAVPTVANSSTVPTMGSSEKKAEWFEPRRIVGALAILSCVVVSLTLLVGSGTRSTLASLVPSVLISQPVSHNKQDSSLRLRNKHLSNTRESHDTGSVTVLTPVVPGVESIESMEAMESIESDTSSSSTADPRQRTDQQRTLKDQPYYDDTAHTSSVSLPTLPLSQISNPLTDWIVKQTIADSVRGSSTKRHSATNQLKKGTVLFHADYVSQDLSLRLESDIHLKRALQSVPVACTAKPKTAVIPQLWSANTSEVIVSGLKRLQQSPNVDPLLLSGDALQYECAIANRMDIAGDSTAKSKTTAEKEFSKSTATTAAGAVRVPSDLYSTLDRVPDGLIISLGCQKCGSTSFSLFMRAYDLVNAKRKAKRRVWNDLFLDGDDGSTLEQRLRPILDLSEATDDSKNAFLKYIHRFNNVDFDHALTPDEMDLFAESAASFASFETRNQKNQQSKSANKKNAKAASKGGAAASPSRSSSKIEQRKFDPHTLEKMKRITLALGLSTDDLVPFIHLGYLNSGTEIRFWDHPGCWRQYYGSEITLSKGMCCVCCVCCVCCLCVYS